METILTGESMKKALIVLCAMCFVYRIIGIGIVSASVISLTGYTSSQAENYIIGAPAKLPFTLTANFNNEPTLYAWDEVQSFILPNDLYVDCVTDPTSSWIGYNDSNYYIKAGTTVSSHYVQWDPLSSKMVMANINLDRDISCLITDRQTLFASDDRLGLPGIFYEDFVNRGIEENPDSTHVYGCGININFLTANPGDSIRIITAQETQPAPVPEPATIFLLGSGLIGLSGFIKRRLKNKLRTE